MMRSLFIKFSMLAITAALIVWIGWPQPQPVQSDSNEPAVQPALTDARAADRHAGIYNERRVDLNRAGIDELEQLPGIGRVLAQRVVDWRGAHGRFRSVEDLANVKGIGAKKLARIKPLVRVGAARTTAEGRG